MATQLETDYLVIGAGASGMAFVDELVHCINFPEQVAPDFPTFLVPASNSQMKVLFQTTPEHPITLTPASIV